MEYLYIASIILIGIIIVTAFWTYIDRKFPSSRMPFVYREELWQNILVNFVLVTVIGASSLYLFYL